MMLQALYDLAERENLVPDPDFETKPVAYLVYVGEGGTFIGIRSTKTTPPAEGNRKPKPVAKDFKVPRQPGRSGSKPPPQFLVDNAKYVFGLGTADKAISAEEGAERAGWFRERVQACAEATGDPACKAVTAFLESVATGRIQIDLPEDCVSNDQFAFVNAPDDTFVHARPAVVEYWREERKQEAGDARWRCLVSGQPITEAGLFPLIEKVPGGQSSGAALVSCKNKACWSYGWSKNENAPVSREAAQKCATALNRLLHPAFPKPDKPDESLQRRHVRLSGDTIVVFWTREASGDAFCDGLPTLFEPKAEDVDNLYRSIWFGRSVDNTDPTAFYAMTLTGAQGRVIVRDWLETTVGEAQRNLADYFADIDLVRNARKPKKRDHPPVLPLQVLLRGLAVHGDLGRLSPALASDVFHAALTGTRFPRQVLQRAIERARAEATATERVDFERRDARAALVKAFLNRQRRLDAGAAQRYPEVQRDMDANNKHTAYRLGRLLAVLERLQEQALGDVNATVVDRYFKRAASTPKHVFIHLLKLRNSHERKLKRDKFRSYVFYKNRIDELLEPLPPEENFPAALDMESQALFLLGYHHERHWLWMGKEEQQEWEKAHAEQPV